MGTVNPTPRDGRLPDMARLRDVPYVLRTVGWRKFLRRVGYEIIDDNLFLFAGSLAYAWLLAIFPFVVFMLTLVPFLPGVQATDVAEDTRVLLHALLPDILAEAIWNNAQEQIHDTVRRKGVLLASLALSLWIASGGVTATMAALDICYELDRVRAWFKRRSMAFALTAALAGVALCMVVLLPLGALFRRWILSNGPDEISFWAIWAFDLLRGLLAFFVAFLGLGLIYQFGPCVKRKFVPVTPGAVFCLTMWVVLGLAFKLYVDFYSGSRYEQNYGAAGWVAIMLIIFYLDALVLLIGAEINSELDFAVLRVPRGSRNYITREKPPPKAKPPHH